MSAGRELFSHPYERLFNVTTRSDLCVPEEVYCLLNFLQDVATGLSIGLVYGMIGVGFVVIHRITGMINFAQGDMAAVRRVYLGGTPIENSSGTHSSSQRSSMPKE